ncbi:MULTISPECIES: type IA DNA topoisomerase [Caproicibacterium]|uniref:DNA topoisomerase n=1 Tax=Caproicibacterium argilliputei TaxID=3030016 RepID=A0AA97D8U5_9FIRM|nr:type IA DNA topoisomerase [Caproicibacterium argilliputei]WOC32351.1 DNA topoisomerase [Caproicibacterium argilliputei]
MKLIIAEKPELGRAIGTALNLTPAASGTMTGSGYTVVWAFGHLMELEEPEKLDSKYAKWNLADLPMFFNPWPSVAIDGKAERLAQIGKLMQQADSIVNAGDPDDEGQYLIDEILDHFHNTKPVERVLINDNTPSEIQKAFQQLQPNDKFRSIGEAAHARALCDKTFGYNYSRFFALKLNVKGMSVGRVQTPTLGLVVNRDKAIEGHVKQKYFELSAATILHNISIGLDFKPLKESLEDGHCLDCALLEDVGANLPHPAQFEITKVQKTEEPPLPFNLVKLQAHMNEKYNIPVSRTLEITQELRDKYKAITYNRSDCQYLNAEQHESAPQILPAVMQRLGVEMPLNYSITSKCFNGENVTAHHAIIPTGSHFDLNALTDEQKNVYTEIALRYLVQFLPGRTTEVTTAEAGIDGKGSFKASTSRVLSAGFADYYPAKAVNTTALSDVPAGQYSAEITDCEISEKFTAPPKRYTQASLITDMTQIAKYVTDPQAKAALKAKDKDKKGENGSIGTPATRDKIIETLIKRGYLQDDGKHLISTPYGRQFYDLLPDDIKKPDLTALWWTIQEDIKSGNANISDMTDSVLASIRSHLQDDYSGVHVSRETNREEIGKCPLCGKPVYEGKLSFRCSGYRDGCTFALWKENNYFKHFGKSLTKAAAKSLLGPHHRCLTKNLTSAKTGKKYDAYFKMAMQDGRPQFSLEFPDKKAPKKTTARRK